jgi:hypothetical protein
MSTPTFIPTHDGAEPRLSQEDFEEAKQQLVKKPAFPRINRKFVDPPREGEPRFALFSYVDCPDAKLTSFLNDVKKDLSPEMLTRLEEIQNTHRLVKGVAKIRGAFLTQQEAQTRAEEIVRDVDSANSVFTCITGAPFPLVSEGMAEQVNEVDLQRETEHAISQNVRAKRRREEKEINELKRREKELMADVEKDPNADDLDNYTDQRTKLAHLRYFISQFEEKHSKYVENEKNCVKWLLDMKSRHPEYEEQYMERYKEGLRKAHIEEGQEHDFIKFMKDPLIALE